MTRRPDDVMGRGWQQPVGGRGVPRRIGP